MKLVNETGNFVSLCFILIKAINFRTQPSFMKDKQGIKNELLQILYLQ